MASDRAGPVSELADVLADSRSEGFLGPQPVAGQIDHARRFLAASVTAPVRALDLGAGGGLPGLVLALEPTWAFTRWVLLDSSERRCSFLRRAAVRLGLGGRVEILEGRAETVAHDAAQRATYDLVVARGFGPPPATAECGAGFLTEGGRLAVSEPPGARRGPRWPPAPLAEVGLVAERAPAATPGLAVFRAVAGVPDRYPRRAAVAAREPLWDGFT